VIPRVTGPVITFCVPGLVFGGIGGVGSRFHVLRAQTLFGCTVRVGSRFDVLLSRTRFRLYRGRRVPFSCFARPESFSAVPRASGHVFMFCAPGLIFGGTVGFGVPFSYFARPDLFSAVTTALGSVFMFCAPGLIFGCTEGTDFRFHVLRARTRFQRFRGRRVLFSCFPLLDMFSAVPWASGPVFMLCASVLIFEGIEGIRSLFMFCEPGLIFGGTEGVVSRFHVLFSRTHFRRCRVLRVPFYSFVLRDSFSTVPRM
jgi:hypothetical protein